MGFALCSAVLLLVAGAEGPRPQATVGVGGGYESNLNLAASGQPSFGSFGSGSVSAWAGAGLAFDLGEETQLYAGGRYDGLMYPNATDLSRNALGLDLSLVQDLGESVALILAPTLAHAWYGESARDSVTFSGRATLRIKPWSRLALRVGYARVQQWASDSVFSTGTNRLLMSAEVRLARGSYLALGYTLSSGDQVFYQTAPANGTGGMGGGMQGSGMFSNLSPYKAAATQSTLSPSWEQGLWEGLYTTVSYYFTWGSSQEGSYTTQSFFGGVGYRF